MITIQNILNRAGFKKQNYLPFFYIDLESAEINKDIFNLNYIIHRKIKNEELQKRQEI